MPDFSFEAVTVPSDNPSPSVPFVNETGSDDPVCQYPGCGEALTYSGRGRKPKYCDEHKRASGSRSSGGSTRGAANVETAVSALHTLYDGLLMPLMLVSPRGAQVWNEQIPGLDERNRVFLANSPDLVKKINSTASKGGSFAFAVSHMVAVAPVVVAVRRDFAERRAIREAENEADTVSDIGPQDYVNPEAAFVR